MTDKHGGFAFPQSNPDVAYSDYIGGGMTLRDWFAGQTLVGLYASMEVQENGWGHETVADLCYDMADVMLAAREVKP
jgi:hypothetical protein